MPICYDCVKVVNILMEFVCGDLMGMLKWCGK
jgi:hypothetical protein